MKASKEFECRNYNFALYEVGNESNGHYGLVPQDVGLHHVPGVRYRVTFEVVGVNPNHKPDIESFYYRWSRPENARRARKILKGGKKFAPARAHAHSVLKAYNHSRTRYRIAMKLWRAWAKATKGKKR